MYIYVVKKTDNVPSRLLPILQWPQSNSCTWAHGWIGNNQEGTLSFFLTTYIYIYIYTYIYIYIYNAHFISVGFEHSVCHEALPTSFICIYIYACIYTNIQI